MRAFEREEWERAIQAFRASISADRHHAESYLALIRAYEAAADEGEEDPKLLELAAGVCREARRLALDVRQRALVDEAADRVGERLREIREAGEEE